MTAAEVGATNTVLPRGFNVSINVECNARSYVVRIFASMQVIGRAGCCVMEVSWIG